MTFERSSRRIHVCLTCLLLILSAVLIVYRIGEAGQVILSPEGITSPMFQNERALCNGTKADTHINLGFPAGLDGISSPSETGVPDGDEDYCTVGGGLYNRAYGSYSTVSGGAENSAGGPWSTVSGGWDNDAPGTRAAVGGGSYNTASGFLATVGGGSHNTASGENSTVGGGESNTANVYYSTVAGGRENKAYANYATVTGGRSNSARGFSSVVLGGSNNETSGDYSAVGGRYMDLGNTADHTFVWGYSDKAEAISTANAFLIFPAGTAGKVGILTDSPNEPLEIAGDGRAFFGDGGGASRKGLLIDGIEGSGAARVEAYDYGAGTGLALVFNTVGNGNVGIGTTSPGYRLEVNGSAGKPGGGSWSNSSDIRLKEITGDYDAGLDEIASLKPVTFRYRKENPRGLPADEEYIGFVAQEVQRVLPEAIHQGADGYLDFNMHPVNVALVNAVKKLKNENDALKADNDSLKQRIEKIEALLGI